MRPLADFPRAARAAIRFVLADIDDTLTLHGRLPARSYAALEHLRAAGLIVVPITGRPAGWCDHIARMWPVDAVVGENGAFYFRYDDAARRMTRVYARDATTRAADRVRLDALRDRILAAVPGAALAADQAYREADLAIDFREDVAPLPPTAIERITALFGEAGAESKVSSIHVNGWFGAYDKLTMTRRLLAEQFACNMDAARETIVFAGDSPNDAPMFGFFPNAVGVANVRAFRLAAEPAWVTQAEAADGFVELADSLLDSSPPPLAGGGRGRG
ncbi:MAG: HAD-IIB family hydrolase [Alphaproteobacteria bacterium]|nr:HAD-IIB family hydrolase [Alphaproteobacteria bacterium]